MSCTLTLIHEKTSCNEPWGRRSLPGREVVVDCLMVAPSGLLERDKGC